MKYSLVLGLVFFLIYNLVIRLSHPEVTISQSQWQENIIKSQRLMYDSLRYDTILVGTSLTNRFDDYLPSNYYSLAFSGGSIYSGLEILKRSGIRPRLVIIEMNVYTRGIDQGFVDGLFAPGLMESRAFLPALKDEYQPMNIIYPVTSKIFTTPFALINNKIIAINNQHHLVKKRTATEININDIEEVKTVNENTIRNNLLQLKEYVSYLEKQKVKFAFFRVPVSCVNEAAFVQDEKRFNLYFPASTNTYLLNSKCNEYKTTDGNHLEDSSARKYATYFLSTVRKLSR